MEIAIKEQTLVRPVEETPNQRLWLSSMDEIQATKYICLVYFYKLDSNSNPNCGSKFFDAKRLKESLSKTLVLFYPVAGRLGYDENGKLELICNGEGVLFLEAEASYIMDDHFICDFSNTSEVLRLIPSMGYSREISFCPLLLLQVTRFKCGGVSVGVGIHHTLADGSSSLDIINSWSNMARKSEGNINIGPIFVDRTLLRPRNPTTPKFQHIEYEPSPPLIKLSNSITNYNNPKSSSSSVAASFIFTPHQLNTLKAKYSSTTNKFTTYTVLTAHIWRCVTKARSHDLANDQPCMLYVPVDGRSKLHPPLPSHYLGNAVFNTATIAPAAELISEPMVDTAKRLQDALMRVDDEYLRSILDYLELHRNVKDELLRGSRSLHSAHLVVVSWMRLPFYEADFGWGGPIYVRPPDVPVEGLVYIMRTPNNDGCYSVLIRLKASHMKLFQHLLFKF